MDRIQELQVEPEGDCHSSPGHDPQYLPFGDKVGSSPRV
jgi:hypothetical protein